MQRALAAVAVLILGLAVLGAPSAIDAKPRPRPPGPTPTPTVQPTPTIQPTPSPTVTPTGPIATPTPTVAATPTPTPTLTPAPTPANLDGIDVSYYQGTINWPQVAAAGKRFAFVRATAGTLTADTQYGINRPGAKAAGLAVGAYHYANPDSATNDAANEARWFLQNATIASGDLLPVLDLEVTNGLSPTAMTTWAQTWLGQVYAATGVRPIIYTNAGFWSTSMANTDWFARNGYSVLWIAHWTTASQPNVPAANWSGYGWTFWQHSQTGTVPGIAGPVDLDRFRGSALPASLFVP